MFSLYLTEIFPHFAPPALLRTRPRESIRRGEHLISELISRRQPPAPSMETWMEASPSADCLHFLLGFCASEYQKHSLQPRPHLPLSADRWGSGENKEEVIVKERGTMSRPRPGKRLGSSPLPTLPGLLPLPHCAVCTRADCNKHVVEDHVCRLP